jgi:hypothetical protein
LCYYFFANDNTRVRRQKRNPLLVFFNQHESHESIE